MVASDGRSGVVQELARSLLTCPAVVEERSVTRPRPAMVVVVVTVRSHWVTSGWMTHVCQPEWRRGSRRATARSSSVLVRDHPYRQSIRPLGDVGPLCKRGVQPLVSFPLRRKVAARCAAGDSVVVGSSTGAGPKPDRADRGDGAAPGHRLSSPRLRRPRIATLTGVGRRATLGAPASSRALRTEASLAPRFMGGGPSREPAARRRRESPCRCST